MNTPKSQRPSKPFHKPPAKSHSKPKSTTVEEPRKNVIKDLLRVQSLFKRAEQLYKEDERRMAEHGLDKSKKDFISVMLQRGTASDRVSSLTMLIQQNPLRSLSNIQQLIALAKKKNKKQAEIAVLSLRDAFANSLLSDDRKLETFQYNELIVGKQANELGEKELVDAYFEHALREQFRELVT
mmetsp:Transcript_13083/g.22067  ORF Transcript_13083/g.22067 Transcript_13083/m.22067 type:complete len:183 (+) Transcript_13083:2-550(+)